MSDDVIEHFSDIFASPGDWLGVSFVAVTHAAELRAEAGGLTTPSSGEFDLEVRELLGGAKAAWETGRGWPAFGTRVRKVAELLGGSCELQSWRKFGYGEERHEVRYMGKAVEV